MYLIKYLKTVQKLSLLRPIMLIKNTGKNSEIKAKILILIFEKRKFKVRYKNKPQQQLIIAVE